MARLTEDINIVRGIAPIDLATGANNGAWVSLKNFDHIAIVLSKSAGAVGEAPVVTIVQAQDVAGTGSKALNFTRIDRKDPDSGGQYTKVTQAAGNTYTPAAGNTALIAVIEFDAQELDLANGFDCLRCTIADVGATAQVGGVLYLLSNSRYPGQYPLSALTD